MAKKKSPKLPVRQTSITRTQQIFSGPLPSPEALAKYNQTLPGAADRIISMAEEQSRHRHYMERTIVRHNGAKSYIGMFFGTVIALAAICGGIYLVSIGYEAWGLAPVITALAGLVGVFVYGKVSQTKELRDKRQSLIQP